MKRESRYDSKLLQIVIELRELKSYNCSVSYMYKLVPIFSCHLKILQIYLLEPESTYVNWSAN